MRQNVARWLAIMLLLFVPHAQAQATRSARPGRPPRSPSGRGPGRVAQTLEIVKVTISYASA